MTKQIRLDVTSSAFAGSNALALAQQMAEACDRYNFTFGIQLHNTCTRETEEKICSWEFPISFHAPVGNEFNMNLATQNTQTAFQTAADNARRMYAQNADMAVFHGFTMIDQPLRAFGHGYSFDECMKVAYRPDLSYDQNSVLNRDFTHTLEFAQRSEYLKKNLAILRETYQDLTFCIENDFPAYSNGNISAAKMIELDHPICLDSSHLWLSSHLLNLDFKHEIDLLTSSNLVKMVHLHASKYTTRQPILSWSDGHLPLATPNEMDLPYLVQKCRRHHVPMFVLEIMTATVNDIDLFAKMYNSIN